MPDGSLDTYFKPNITSGGSVSVRALILNNNTLYIAGVFETDQWILAYLLI